MEMFFYGYQLVAATSGCRCGQAVIVVSSHITFFFGLQSSVWNVFRTDLFNLWLCSLVSSYGHVGLKPNMVVRLSLVRNIYIS